MRTLRTVILIAILSVALAETVARAVPAIPPMVANLEPERVWEDRFLDMMRGDRNIIMGGFHRPHPTRGWTVAPHAHETVDGFSYTTNERAYRSLSAYTPDPAKYTVLAIGDSFTFGIDTNDTATWPYLLQQRDSRLNVINLGVGGYGIDQMYVTLRETIHEYRPRLVIVAFVGDDVRRAFLSFRDYKKPRFVLRQGLLQLMNTPVGAPDEVIREIEERRRSRLERSYTARILRGITRRALESSAPPADVPLGRGAIELVTRLFDEMHDLTRREGAEFLLVYLSYGEGLFDASLVEEGEEFLRRYGAERPVATLDMRPFFLQPQRKDWVKGHYQARENLVVSEVIRARILPLISRSRGY